MNVAPPAPADVSEAGPSTVAPSKQVYSGSKKNWDEIETDLKKKEEEEKPEGEEALNKLFKDIYGRADVRAARRQDARALPARVPAPVAHVHGNCAWEARGMCGKRTPPTRRATACTAQEDTRRAMNKSFQTSGGTVLSTNWGEIKEKDYEKEKEDGTLKPPDGQQWKKWG
jgi:hypothetical protein